MSVSCSQCPRVPKPNKRWEKAKDHWNSAFGEQPFSPRAARRMSVQLPQALFWLLLNFLFESIEYTILSAVIVIAVLFLFIINWAGQNRTTSTGNNSSQDNGIDFSFGVLILFVTISVSIALYWMRGRYRRTYGVIEILYALAALIGFLMGNSTGIVATSIYIIVRGLDNVYSSLPSILEENGQFDPKTLLQRITVVWERWFLLKCDRVKSGGCPRKRTAALAAHTRL